MYSRLIALLFGGVVLASQLALTAYSQVRESTIINASQRYIVKRHHVNKLNASRLFLSARHELQRARGESGSLEVFVDHFNADSAATLSALRAQSDVEYAVIDRRRYAHALPTDALFNEQWYLQTTEVAAIGATTAWDVTTGSLGTVVAVLDTGVRFNHPDLLHAAQNGKLLPGFDFVSAENGGGALTANDGDGWDTDPSDPGDWISADDLNRSDNFFDNCGSGVNRDLPTDSSWHGTRVAGLISAASNNGSGIAGTSWSTYILPVRVLGKCGGYDSDILVAMRWAAGIPVSGVPDNPYPAKIINLSLGSEGVCSAAYRDVVAELTARGVLVVVSAGNEGGPVNEPANCPGAVAVAGLRHAGTKVGYSSLGPEVAIAAPAGNCVNLSGPCLFALATTTNTGATSPGTDSYTDSIRANIGTSFSAPLASGVAALMHAVNGRLPAAQFRQRLMEAARPFPANTSVPTCHIPANANDVQLSECNCTTSTCGAGMLHAPGAVAAAQRPVTQIAPPSNIVGGTPITLDGSASFAACSRTVISYSWTVVGVNGATSPVISNADQSIATVVAPTTGSFTLRLTIADNQNAGDSADIEINSNSATTTATPAPTASICPVAITPPATIPSPTPVPAAAPPPQRSSGGGNFSWLLFFCLSVLGVLKTRGTRQS